MRYCLKTKPQIQENPRIAISAPNDLTYMGPYLAGHMYEPGILPMFPIALTMATEAAFLAYGLGTVLEIQAKTMNPDA